MVAEHIGRQHPTTARWRLGDAGNTSEGAIEPAKSAHAAPKRANVLQGASACICVDDYGLSDGISAAALVLIEMQRVHAVGCMVGAPMWAPWSGRIRGVAAAQVDVGLHLDLTQHPILPATKMPLASWIRRSYLRQVDWAVLRAEIDAQLDKFENRLGRPPAYVDGHQHVHQLPGVRELLVEALQLRYRRDSSSLPWLRSTRGVPLANLRAAGGASAWVKSRVIAALGEAGLAALARRAGIPQNRFLIGVYGFDADHARYLDFVMSGLRAGGDGSLLMSHPALVDDAEHGLARVVEFEVLRSEGLAQRLADAGISLRSISSGLKRRHAADGAV